MEKTAYVGFRNIERLHVTPLEVERTHQSTGNLAVHPEVAVMYVTQEYDKQPRSREERDAMGRTGSWNGLNTSFPSIRTYPSATGNVVVAEIAPTRYLVGKAGENVVDEMHHPTYDDIRSISPDMANVSLVVPVRYQGDFYLLAQIKGKDAKGSGEIHTGLVAGGVKPSHLSSDDPLVAALKNNASLELGLDLNALSYSSAGFIIDEGFQGMVNVAYIAEGIDLDTVLSSYEEHTQSEGTPQVAGLALVPLRADLSEIPDQFKGVRHGLNNVICFFPGKDGLEEHRLDRIVRQFTVATTRFLNEDPDNAQFLLRKGGF